MKNSHSFFWLFSIDVSRTVLPSTAEGKKVARFVSLACFEGRTIDQPGERGRVLLWIYWVSSWWSCIPFSMKGNSALCKGCSWNWFCFAYFSMGQLHQWWYKSFALFWMMYAGGLLVILNISWKKRGVLPGLPWTICFPKCKSLWLHSPCGAPGTHSSWESGPKHLLHFW